MLKYQRVGGSDAMPEYEYLIEGRPEEVGHISFDISAQDGVMLDHNGETLYQRYASKLIGCLDQQMDESGALLESGTYMWY
ncbi:MAG: hypothetical protein SPC25_00430 [Atopobiaceae bacterium]|nr:hypothetical protein [Atopobiaceae bacterium]